MAKLLLNKKGFLLVELLIIFIVLSIITSISLMYINDQQVLYQNELISLEATLNSAKQLALNKGGKTSLIFDDHYLNVIHNNKVKKYYYKSIVFDKSIDLYFNQKGSINKGYTIHFKQYNINKKIIFYLGKGWYKIE